MSRRDRTRLVAIAKGLAVAALLAGGIWLGVCIREWEHQRIARLVVEELRK